MGRKTLALVGVLLAVLAGIFALWRGLEGGARPSTAVASAPNSESGATPGAALGANAPDLAPPVAEEPRSQASGIESLDGASAQTESFALDDALWIVGVVHVPKNAPPDDTLAVWALDDESAAPFASLGDLNWTLREDRKNFRFWSRRPLGPDGSFRLPIPSNRKSASIVLDGRFLYLDDPAHVVLAEKKEVELDPVLGAEIAGTCVLPADVSKDESPVGTVAEYSGLSTGEGLPLGRSRFMVQRRSRIGDDLHFSLRAVPIGLRAEVQAVPDRLATATTNELHLAAGVRTAVNLEFLRGARVSGRIVDENGAGLAAHVRVEPDRGPQFSFRFPTPYRKPATCTDDGTFELVGVAPGKGTVIAELDGYVAARGELLAFREGAREHVDLTLRRGEHLEGRVTWPDGSPAAGTAVVVTVQPDPDVAAKASRRSRAPRFETCRAKTDEKGAFSIAGLEPGPYTLTATSHRAPDGATPGENLPEWRAELDGVVHGTLEEPLVLKAPVALAGRVVDDLGAPVKKFTLNARTPDDPAHVRSASSWKTKTFEDENGAFLVPGMQAGRWKIDAAADGYVASNDGADIELPASAPLVLTLVRAGSASGTVLDPDGQPVQGAVVSIDEKPFRNPTVWAEVEPKESDGRGAFEIAGLPVGSVALVASSTAFARSEPVSVESTPGQRVEGLVLRLRRGGRLTGEIFDAHGARGAGSRLQIMSTNARERREVEADASGNFEVDHVTPGTYQVVAEPSRAVQAEIADQAGGSEEADVATLFAKIKMTSAVVREGETTHVVLGAPPRAPVRVFGNVTMAGEPVRNGMIVCVGEGGSVLAKMKMSKLGEDGSYELVLDEPGDVVLTYQRMDGPGSGMDFPVTIPEEKEHRVDLELPVGRLRGIVRAADGRALEGIDVELQRGSESSFFGMLGGNTNVATDKDGRFEFTGLAPGRYGVAAGGAVFDVREGRPAAWGRVVRSGIAVAKGQVVDGIEIRLSAPGRITGMVRGPDGNPLTDASVFVRDERGEVLQVVSRNATDASGRFTCGGLAPGSYTLCARTKTLASPESAAVVVREGDATEVELTAGPGTMLSVSVEDKDGKSLRATFTVDDERGREVGALTGAGRVETLMAEGLSSRVKNVGPLPPGEYRVTAHAFDGRSASRTIQLRGQDERGLKLRLE